MNHPLWKKNNFRYDRDVCAVQYMQHLTQTLYVVHLTIYSTLCVNAKNTAADAAAAVGTVHRNSTSIPFRFENDLWPRVQQIVSRKIHLSSNTRHTTHTRKNRNISLFSLELWSI